MSGVNVIWIDNISDVTNMDIIISMLFGLICAIIIYRFYICPPIVRGPNSRDIIDKIFEIDGKFYELEPVVCGCIKK